MVAAKIREWGSEPQKSNNRKGLSKAFQNKPAGADLDMSGLSNAGLRQGNRYKSIHVIEPVLEESLRGLPGSYGIRGESIRRRVQAAFKAERGSVSGVTISNAPNDSVMGMGG